MDAGIDLNILVAGQLGWTRLRRVQPDYMPVAQAFGFPPGADDYETGLPDYSREIGAAWRIVQAMEDKFLRLYLEEFSDGWYAAFAATQAERAKRKDVAGTAPHAICLAFLKATGDRV